MNKLNKFKLRLLAFGSFLVVLSLAFSYKYADSQTIAKPIQEASGINEAQAAVNTQPVDVIIGDAPTSSPQSEVVVQPQVIEPATPPSPPPFKIQTTSQGMSISIPKIALNAQVITVGLEKNGALHVPENGLLAGWYNNSPKPGNTSSSGQVGSSIITGHMDFGRNFTPGVFYNLHKLSVGDEIYVSRGDGKTAVFTVQKMETYRQDAFPTQKVYGPTSAAELRVITCAGSYNPKTGNYTHDLVVYATLSNIIPS